ncbi:helix-turn-helix domain-containing protein [Kribbella sp. NBC_01245]|uniref:helix-turn-helix domain-containing protein n=1 Tax=Kribbella sp. NBC_01245 TaxID=2903578 RepID=UPI002E2BA7AB|nr:helix-turn-helix transcriptional regulator [Kribbella sp. NBC_01245]
MREAETGDDRFGRELRRLREKAGLTQVQLATRLGYNHTYVSKLEGGSRVPRIAFAGGADELLGAGGSLIALATNVRARRQQDDRGFADGTVGVPLPRPPVAILAAPPPPARRVHLPSFGVACPLHGVDGCAVTAPAEGLEGLVGDTARTVGAETVHGLAAMLVSYIEADLVGGGCLLSAPLEQTLRAIVGLVPKAPEAVAIALLRLAAQYADLAAKQRINHGQHGIGMTWLHRSVEWASASRDHAAACGALSSMSGLALLEGDGATAVEYARAVAAVDRGRRWTVVQAGLVEARGHALLGDWREVDRLSNEAQRAADRLGDRDRLEAPWLFDAEGATYIASHLAGALRDLTETTEDRAIASRAVAFSESALANVPPWMPASRLLLTLRLADSQACGGAFDAAIAVARPVLDAAQSAGSIRINHELDRLRLRLGDRCEDLLTDL